jgi:hypothetical protein
MRRIIPRLLTVALCALAFNASARFVSVDPVQANPNTGANFNRYYYGNNNPYRFTDPDGRAACPKSSGGTCIDSPRTESGTTPQAGPTAQQQAVDSQVRTASRTNTLADGTRLNFNGQEQGFKASTDGTASNPMTTSCQACSDGSKREVGSYNLRALGPNESGGHTHTVRTSGLPGPEDGRMANATDKTAYVISPRGAYGVEKTDVGYRVRVLDGQRLTPQERINVRQTIDAWNRNSGGSGVSSCSPIQC